MITDLRLYNINIYAPAGAELIVKINFSSSIWYTKQWFDECEEWKVNICAIKRITPDLDDSQWGHFIFRMLYSSRL